MPTFQADPWRQTFHITPPTGLLNDPNGLVYWNGHYHVFFQWNPEGCSHENKAWAHVRSPDLVHWEWLPPALSPTESFETHGCYSGSAVAADQSLFLIYTGNVRTADGGRETYQCLAKSSDGSRFEKLGPVIHGPSTGYTSHFRDPKVWRHDGDWWMVLGAQTLDRHGTVLLLRSPDLRDWSLEGPLLAPGEHGYMCECPDMFSLDGQHVLLLCQQHEHPDAAIPANVSGFVAGHYDRESRTFSHAPFSRLDQGGDFYAPQTLAAPDGRRLLFGWMGMPEQTVAPTCDFGWMHCLSVPRELSWIDGRLCQQPARELRVLRKQSCHFDDVTVDGCLALPGVQGATFELDLKTGDDARASWCLDLRCQGNERTTLAVDQAAGRIFLETCPPSSSRPDNGEPIQLGTAPLPESGIGRVHILVDQSSVEIFLNDGALCFSARIYPGPGTDRVQFRSASRIRFSSVGFWSLCAPPPEDRPAMKRTLSFGARSS